MKRIMWINMVLGLWLIVAPFLLAYAGSNSVAAINDVILGVLLVAGAWWVVASMSAEFGVSGFLALCGIWLIIAPFVLGFSLWSLEMISDVVVGIVAFVVSAVRMWAITHQPAKTA